MCLLYRRANLLTAFNLSPPTLSTSDPSYIKPNKPNSFNRHKGWPLGEVVRDKLCVRCRREFKSLYLRETSKKTAKNK